MSGDDSGFGGGFAGGDRLADEAARLLEATRQWARQAFGDGEAAHLATGAPTCQWCPICQLVSLVRGDRPEVGEQLVAAGVLLLDALRAALDPRQGHGGEDPGERNGSGADPADQPGTSRTGTSPRVHRIQLGGDLE